MLVVERLRGPDVGRVAKVAHESLQERYGPDWVQQHLQNERCTCLVARELPGNHVVGFVVAEDDDAKRCNLLALAVDQIHRGRGIGGALLKGVEDEVARGGRMAIHLDVRADDARAQDFYRRHGFAPLGLRERAYQDGADAVRMARPLR